jgi:3-phenylpropionate/trans-cinnamate dioxygenase ferredoxin reductase component
VSQSGPVVIIGANLCGGRAAETLRQEGHDGPVVLIGEEPDRPYERPPLSKEVLRGDAAPDSVFLRDASWYEDNEIELRLGSRATALDPAGTITLADGDTVPFDRCLLATGGRPRRLEVPGTELDGVTYLRTRRDAERIASALTSRPRVVVVGAGFIGAEVAASARTLGCEVTMLEVLPVPLRRVLGEDIGRLYASIHQDQGVDLRLATGIERIDGTARAEAVVTTSDDRVDADLVVIGVGIEPNVELAVDAGIACDNGIGVDEHCRTSHPNVFAAGDVARRPDAYSGGTIRVEHFQNAQNQGVAAARSMLGKDDPFQEVPWFWSDQYDVNLQMLGHFSPDETERVVRGDLAARDFIAFSLRDGHLVGAIAMNRGRDISAARRLMERRVAVDGTRLADEQTPLKDLLKT